MSETIIKTWGVVSDTHGLMREEVFPHLEGVEHILHAGDVGDMKIIERLNQIAPVTAVRGNIDRRSAAAELPLIEHIEFDQHLISMVHIREDLDLIPEAAGIPLVVFGHTHQPLIQHKGPVCYFNPGSIGPRRFSLPISMGRLHLLADGTLLPELIEL